MTLTYDQARDRAAELLGWERAAFVSPAGTEYPVWRRGKNIDCGHPIPDTLDAIARLFEEHLPGWTWVRANDYWGGYSNDEDDLPLMVYESGDTLSHEKHDRLTLFIACWEAEHKTP